MRDAKHKDLIKAYLRVIKGYGPNAKHIPKSVLYEMAGAEVYLTSRYAGKAIRKIIRFNKSMVVQAEKELMEEVNV